MSTRRTLTPFERAAVRHIVQVQPALRSEHVREAVVTVATNPLMVHWDAWEDLLLGCAVERSLRLDGEVAREACGAALSPYAGFLPWLIPVRGDVAGYAVPRVLAHTTVGACDSWIAELADGRVAVAVRTPGVEVAIDCKHCWIYRQAEAECATKCRHCDGRGWNPKRNPGRWYRATFPVDPQARDILADALTQPDGKGWVLLGDYLQSKGHIDLAKWPKPWPAKWRIAPA